MFAGFIIVEGCLVYGAIQCVKQIRKGNRQRQGLADLKFRMNVENHWDEAETWDDLLACLK